MAKSRDITEKLESFGMYDLEGPVDTLIEELQRIKEDYPHHTNLRIVEDSPYWDNDDQYGVYGTRPETDQEKEKRLEKARKARETRKKNKEEAERKKTEKEKAEYLRLKEKYDG
jgi:hypothetical protein